jgi:hypothetical protein
MKKMLEMLALVVMVPIGSCGVPDVVRPPEIVIVAESAWKVAEVPEPALEPEVVAKTEPDPEVVTVEVATELPAYRNRRYIDQCRRDGRRDAPAAEPVDDRDDARSRARALARAGDLDEVLVFSRMAYGEAGTPIRGRNDNDYEAMLTVLDGLRGRMSRVEMFVNYAPRRIFPRADKERQMWLSELQLSGARPPSWPSPRGRRGRFHPHPPWRAYGCPRWLATVDAVRKLLRDNQRRIVVTDSGTIGPCSEIPDHWGGEEGVDDEAIERGWRLVNCGTTRNRFWEVPARLAARMARAAARLEAERVRDADLQ